MSSIKKKILIIGPLPPPYIGPAIATDILLKSGLKNFFHIHHFNTNTHSKLDSVNEISILRTFKTITLFPLFFIKLLQIRADIVLVPISETTIGYLKDSAFMILGKLLGRKSIA